MTYPAVESLIPHRGPMRLIDAVTDHGADHVRCAAHIGAQRLFLRDGQARAVWCIEYMAQAVAAYSGLHARASGQGGEPRVGYLIAASRVAFYTDVLRAGDQLDIHAKRVFGDKALGKFECAVTRAGAIIADATVSVFLPPQGATNAMNDSTSQGAP